MVKVAVKWNKRVFADVEVAPNVPEFKAKLQELTVRNNGKCSQQILVTCLLAEHHWQCHGHDTSAVLYDKLTPGEGCLADRVRC